MKDVLRNSAIEASAASACRAFLSFFRPASGVGRRPKLAFIGWTPPGCGVVMWRRRAPIIEVSGKTGGGFPAATAAAATAAANPEAIDST